MKIKFVLEKFEKESDDLGISINAIKAMVQNIGSSSGDTYLFNFVFPVEQMEKVKTMLAEFKDVLITASKTYELDSSTGVLLFRTIPTQTKESDLKIAINEIMDDTDTMALLYIRHSDELIAKFAGMKIKYFDKEEFIKTEELFGAGEFEFDEWTKIQKDSCRDLFNLLQIRYCSIKRTIFQIKEIGSHRISKQSLRNNDMR